MSVPDSAYAPLAPEDWPDALDSLRDGFAGRLNIYKVMAHHPALLQAWSALRTHVVTQNALGPERQEIVILRVAHRLDAHYEWAHHVSRSRALGLEEMRIQAMAGPVDAMRPEDAAMARAVDALIDHARLTPESQQAIEDMASAPAVLDLMATVGFYQILGYLAKSFDVPLDEGLDVE